MAAEVFRAYVKDEPVLGGFTVHVDSAGLSAVLGSPAAQQARRALAKRNLSLEHHRSAPLDLERVEYDLILTMTESHKAQILLKHPETAARVYTLKEYAGMSTDLDIADPFGQSVAAYEETLKEIETAVKAVVRRLAREWANE